MKPSDNLESFLNEAIRPKFTLFAKERKFNLSRIWNECRRGDWLLWLADRYGGYDEVQMTLAKLGCAELVLHRMRDDRSKNAVSAVLDYITGKSEYNEFLAAYWQAGDALCDYAYTDTYHTCAVAFHLFTPIMPNKLGKELRDGNEAICERISNSVALGGCPDIDCDPYLHTEEQAHYLGKCAEVIRKYLECPNENNVLTHGVYV